jgi:hypothetical protein
VCCGLKSTNLDGSHERVIALQAFDPGESFFEIEIEALGTFYEVFLHLLVSVRVIPPAKVEH